MVTIKDIAKKVGVSPSTVSKALSDRNDIAPSTKRRIKNVVEKLGYSPNSIARALVTKSTKTIGLVTSFLGNPALIERIKGVQSVAFLNSHVVISCFNEGRAPQTRQQIEALISRRVDGIIFTPGESDERISGIVRDGRVPFVFMSEMLLGVAACDYTGDDDYEGGKLAMEHLTSLGHRRISYFGVSDEVYSHREVLKGYREILDRYEISYDKKLLTSGNLDVEVLSQNLDRVLGLRNPPTAIFAWSDLMAVNIFEKLKEKKLKVPEDISLVGYDNMDFLSVFHIPLTTVSQPNYQIGYTAGNLLLERIEKGNQFPPRKIIYKPELVIRKSTSRIQ